MNQVISNEVTIQPLQSIAGLTEIVQTKNLRFAFLYPLYHQREDFGVFHPTVKCRDYLSDVIHYKVANKEVYIYGFSLKPTQNKLDPNCARLLLDFPDIQEAKKFINNFEFLTDFEQANFNLSPSKLFAVKTNPGCLVLEADVFWQGTTQLMSLLTLLCRIALYPQAAKGKWLEITEGIDGQYIRWLKLSKVEKTIPLLKQLDLAQSPSPSGWELDCGVYSVHDHSGIISFMCCDLVGSLYQGLVKENHLWKQFKQLKG